MNEQFEFKSAASGAISLDEMQGIVECFVAGIGNKDSVGDIVVTGAFAKSLTRRKPRVVWAHSWNDPIGKVLEMYEVPPGDSRLPAKMRNAGIGGLYAKVQFNLQSEKGKEAFASVAFFGEEQEWSIGYKTINGAFDPAQQANVLKEVELYEVSPVLHGANQLTGTISVKSEQKNHMMPIIAGMPMMGEQQQPRMIVIAAPEKEQEQDEPFNIFAEGLAQPLEADKVQKIQAELSERTGSKVDIVEATDSFIVFRRTTTDGKVSMYRVGYHTPDGYNTFMFGKPEAYSGSDNKPQMQQEIEVKPADASMVPMQPQQMPYRDDDQDEMNTMLGGQVGVGKSAYAHLIEIPQIHMVQAKSMLQPVFNYHKLSTTDSDNGIIVNGSISAQAIDALQNAVKAIGQTIGQSVGNLRTLAQSFNPYAIDGDNDGFAQDGTAFQRPYIPIKKPDIELPEVGGKKRNSSELLDKPTIRTGKKPTKDPGLLQGQERQEALAAGELQPRTMDDISFLANRRPENEGLAKYWDMSEEGLRAEGQKLVAARRGQTGSAREATDGELFKISHEFSRREAYKNQFGKEFVPPKRTESTGRETFNASKPDEVMQEVPMSAVLDAMKEWSKSRSTRGFGSRGDVTPEQQSRIDASRKRGSDIASGRAQILADNLKNLSDEDKDFIRENGIVAYLLEDGTGGPLSGEWAGDSPAERIGDLLPEGDWSTDSGLQADAEDIFASYEEGFYGQLDKEFADLANPADLETESSRFDKLSADEQDSILEQGRDSARGLASRSISDYSDDAQSAYYEDRVNKRRVQELQDEYGWDRSTAEDALNNWYELDEVDREEFYNEAGEDTLGGIYDAWETAQVNKENRSGFRSQGTQSEGQKPPRTAVAMQMDPKNSKLARQIDYDPQNGDLTVYYRDGKKETFNDVPYDRVRKAGTDDKPDALISALQREQKKPQSGSGFASRGGGRGPYSSRGEYDPTRDPYFDIEELDEDYVQQYLDDKVKFDGEIELEQLERYNNRPDYGNRGREPLSDADIQDLFDRYQSEDDAVSAKAGDEILDRFYLELREDYYDDMVESTVPEPDYEDYMRSRDGFSSLSRIKPRSFRGITDDGAVEEIYSSDEIVNDIVYDDKSRELLVSISGQWEKGEPDANGRIISTFTEGRNYILQDVSKEELSELGASRNLSESISALEKIKTSRDVTNDDKANFFGREEKFEGVETRLQLEKLLLNEQRKAKLAEKAAKQARLDLSDDEFIADLLPRPVRSGPETEDFEEIESDYRSLMEMSLPELEKELEKARSAYYEAQKVLDMRDGGRIGRDYEAEGVSRRENRFRAIERIVARKTQSGDGKADGFASRSNIETGGKPTPKQQLRAFERYLDSEYGNNFMDYTQMSDEEVKNSVMRGYRYSRSEANAFVKKLRRDQDRYDKLWEDADNASAKTSSRLNVRGKNNALGKWWSSYGELTDDEQSEIEQAYFENNPGSERPGSRDYNPEVAQGDFEANPEKYGYAEDFRKQAILSLRVNGADRDEAENVADYWIENDGIHEEYLEEADGDTLYAMALAYDNYIEAAADDYNERQRGFGSGYEPSGGSRSMDPAYFDGDRYENDEYYRMYDEELLQRVSDEPLEDLIDLNNEKIERIADGPFTEEELTKLYEDGDFETIADGLRDKYIYRNGDNIDDWVRESYDTRGLGSRGDGSGLSRAGIQNVKREYYDSDEEYEDVLKELKRAENQDIGREIVLMDDGTGEMVPTEVFWGSRPNSEGVSAADDWAFDFAPKGEWMEIGVGESSNVARVWVKPNKDGKYFFNEAMVMFNTGKVYKYDNVIKPSLIGLLNNPSTGKAVRKITMPDDEKAKFEVIGDLGNALAIVRGDSGFASRGDEIPEMRPYSDLTSKEKSDLYESIENYLNGRGDWARIKNELEEGGFDYDDFLQQNPEFHPDFADFGDAGDMGFASRGKIKDGVLDGKNVPDSAATTIANLVHDRYNPRRDEDSRTPEIFNRYSQFLIENWNGLSKEEKRNVLESTEFGEVEKITNDEFLQILEAAWDEHSFKKEKFAALDDQLRYMMESDDGFASRGDASGGNEYTNLQFSREDLGKILDRYRQTPEFRELMEVQDELERRMRRSDLPRSRFTELDKEETRLDKIAMAARQQVIEELLYEGEISLLGDGNGLASRGGDATRTVQDFERLGIKYDASTIRDSDPYERVKILADAKAELTAAIDEAEKMLDGLDEDSPEWERIFNAQQDMEFSLSDIEDEMDEMVSEKERLNDAMGLAATLSGEANDLVETRRGITRPSAEDLDELSFEDSHYEYISLMRDINYLVDENNLSVDWSEEKQSEIEKMLRDGRYEKAEDMLYDVTREIFDTTDDIYRTAEAEYDDYPFLDSDNLGRYNSGFASRGGSRFDTFETPNSSAIEAVHYDRNTGELHVAFKPGQTGGEARYYTYSGVPADYFDNEVRGSNSIGRVINDVKKNYDVEVTDPRTVDAINGRGDVSSTSAKLGPWSTTRGSRTGAILAEGDDYYYTISPDGRGGYRASAYSKRSGSEVDRMGQYETLEAAKAWSARDYETRTRGTASPSKRSEIQDIDVRRSAALYESYYDPDTEELVVTFKDKDGNAAGSYIYEGVTADEANELASASSKGKIINRLKASKSVRRAGANDRMERTPGAEDDLGAGGYEAQVDSHWDKIGPEEQRAYFARAVDSAINAGTGTSADEITADAKARAYDDRQIAMMEMQAEELGMGYRKIDVGSSAALNRVEYDPDKRELRVEYRGRDGKGNGEFYVYQNVPQSVVDDIEASDSRGATLRRVRDDFEFRTETAIPESAFYSMGDMGERSNPKITNRTNANGFYLDENGRATNYNKRAYTTSDIQKINGRRNGRDGFASGRLGPPPDDAEYGRELAAQRARDRAAGRNATNPIGNMDRDGEPMDYSVEDGFASRASINESSTGQRIVPSRMHSDDREALAEITDPEERKQRIDELIEFYGPRIFAKPSSPRRKRIVQTQDENGFWVGPDGKPADFEDGFASGGVLNEEYDDLREFGYSPEDKAKNDEMVMEAYLNEFDEEAPSLEDAYEFWAQRAQELREERSNSLMDAFSSLRDEVNALGISDRELGAYGLDGAAFLTAESLIDNPLESDSTDISEAEDYVSRMKRSINQLAADMPEEYDYMDEEPMDGFASGGVDFDRYGNMPSRPKKPRRTGDPSLRNTPKNRARMTAERRLAEMANSGDPEYDNLMQRAKDALSKEGVPGYKLTNEYGEPNSLVAGKMQEILAQDILDGATPKTGGDRPKVDPLSILGGYSDGDVIGLTPRGFASRGESGVKRRTKEDVFADMQKQLIDALEDPENLGKWKLPWRRTGMPENGATGKKYSGSNWFFLSVMSDIKGYDSNKWATYNQWQGLGGQVRKGEKGTQIFVPMFMKGKEKADGTMGEGKIIFKAATVFNLKQIDGMPADFDKKEILPEAERVADLEKTISEIPAVIKNGGDRAFFQPSGDFIQVPNFENFNDARSYYSTVGHELMHWTGGKGRLDREQMGAFGTPEYAYEELVAEIASAIFMSSHNIEPDIQENHGPYLASWLKALKQDPDALQKAMTDAQKAVNYILDISPNAKSKFSNGEKAEFETPEIAVVGEPVVAVEGFASRGDWPTPGGYEPSEFDMRTALSQIGRGNLMAISGTRAKKRNNEMVLPVNRNQQVIVGYDGGSDTYFVRAEQIITNGKDKGKTRVLGQWDNVYADELGETAYQASLKPSMLSDENKTVWAQAFDHPQTGSLLDENGQVYEGGFASGGDSMDPDELDAMDWAYDAAQDYLMEQEDMMPEEPSPEDGFASRMNLSTPEKNEIIAIARRMNTPFTRSVVEQYDRNGELSDRQWDALNRMTLRGNRGGFPSRGGDKGPRTPKARWSPEDRQRFADGDRLRSKKRPGKRRSGPDASEYGFASRGDQKNPIDMIERDIFFEGERSGRSWGFEPIIARVAEKFGGTDRGRMSDVQLADELGIDVAVAKKMRKPGARTSDIYLLDNLRIRVAGEDRTLWGVNNDPLAYYDESGNPITDYDKIPDVEDTAPDVPGARGPRTSRKQKYIDPRAVFEEVGIDPDAPVYSISRGNTPSARENAKIFGRDTWRRIFAEGITADEIDTLLKAKKSKKRSADIYSPEELNVAPEPRRTDSMPLADVFKNQAFDSARGRRGFPQQVVEAIAEITGRRPSISAAKNFINNPRSASGSSGRSPLTITPAQIRLLLDKLGISAEEFEKFRSE
jgi:HK97 family phage prohead protease